MVSCVVYKITIHFFFINFRTKFYLVAENLAVIVTWPIYYFLAQCMILEIVITNEGTRISIPISVLF